MINVIAHYSGVGSGNQQQVHRLPILGTAGNWLVYSSSKMFSWIMFRKYFSHLCSHYFVQVRKYFLESCSEKYFFTVVFSRGSLELLRLLEGHEYGGQVVLVRLRIRICVRDENLACTSYLTRHHIGYFANRHRLGRPTLQSREPKVLRPSRLNI